MEQEPNVLSVGTEVSARYKGAFCEAKIKRVDRQLKFKIQFASDNSQHTIEEADIVRPESPSSVNIGSKVTCKNPVSSSSSSEPHLKGTIVKVFDQSKYHVVFDDGDEASLKRSLMFIKSGRHFADSETLDHLPLTNPEHFGNPVMNLAPRRSSGRRKHSNLFTTTPKTSRKNSAPATPATTSTGVKNRSQSDTNDSDDDSNPAAYLKKRFRTTKYIDPDAGKVVCVDYADKRGTKNKDVWFPALVLSRRFCEVSTNHKASLDEYRVRSFRDDRYYTVLKKEAWKFEKDVLKDEHSSELRSAIEKAINFIDSGKLPNNWDSEEYLCDSQDSQDESSNSTTRSSSRRAMPPSTSRTKFEAEKAEETNNESEEEDEFETDSELELGEVDEQEKEKVKQRIYLEKNDELLAQIFSNTSCDLDPNIKINGVQLNLYRLHRLVDKMGGWKVIKNKLKVWEKIFVRLGLGDPSAAPVAAIKHEEDEDTDMSDEGTDRAMSTFDRCKTVLEQLRVVYEKILFPFDDVQRKLGTNMIYNTPGSSRPQRGERKRDEERSRLNSVTSITSSKETTSLSNARKNALASASKANANKANAASIETTKEPTTETAPLLPIEPPSKEKPVNKDKTEDKKKKKKSDLGPPTSQVEHKQEDNEESCSSSIAQSSAATSSGPTKPKKGLKEESDEMLPMPTDIREGIFVSVLYGQGISYPAKVVSIKIDPDLKEWLFYVHYTGWSHRYDEWINRNRVLKVETEKLPVRRKGKNCKHEPNEPGIGGGPGAESLGGPGRKTSLKGTEATLAPNSGNFKSEPKTPRSRHESSASLRSETGSTKGSSKASSATPGAPAEGDKRVSQRAKHAGESMRERTSSMSMVASGSGKAKPGAEPDVGTPKRTRTYSSSRSETVVAAPPSTPSVTTRREKEKRQLGVKTDEAQSTGSSVKTHKDSSGAAEKEKTKAKRATDTTDETSVKPSKAEAKDKKESKRSSKEDETPVKKKRSAEEPSLAMKKRSEGLSEAKQQRSSNNDAYDFVDEDDNGASQAVEATTFPVTKSKSSAIKSSSKSEETTSNKKLSKNAFDKDKEKKGEPNEDKKASKTVAEPLTHKEESKKKKKSAPATMVKEEDDDETVKPKATSSVPTTPTLEITPQANNSQPIEALVSEESSTMQSAGGEDLEVQSILAAKSPDIAVEGAKDGGESLRSEASSTITKKEGRAKKKVSSDISKDEDLESDRSPVELIMAQEDEEEEDDKGEKIKDKTQDDKKSDTQAPPSEKEERKSPEILVKTSNVEALLLCEETVPASPPSSPPPICSEMIADTGSLHYPAPSQTCAHDYYSSAASTHMYGPAAHFPSSQESNFVASHLATPPGSSAAYYDPGSKQLLYKTTPKRATDDLSYHQANLFTSGGQAFRTSPSPSATPKNSKLTNIIVPPNIASNIMNMSTSSSKAKQAVPLLSSHTAAAKRAHQDDDEDDEDEDEDRQTPEDGEDDNDADDEDNNGHRLESERSMKAKNVGRKRRSIGRTPSKQQEPSNLNVSQESSQDGEEQEEMDEEMQIDGGKKKARDKDGEDDKNEDSSSGGTKRDKGDKEFASPAMSPSKKRRRGRIRTPSHSESIVGSSKDKASVGCKTRGRTYVRTNLLGGHLDANLFGLSTHRNSPTNDYQRQYASSLEPSMNGAASTPASSILINFTPRILERPDYSSWADHKMNVPEVKTRWKDLDDEDKEKDEYKFGMYNYMANFKPSDDAEKNIAMIDVCLGELRDQYLENKDKIAELDRKYKKILYKREKAEKKAKKEAAKAAATAAAASAEVSQVSGKNGNGNSGSDTNSTNNLKSERVTRLKRGNSNMTNTSDEEKTAALALSTS